MFALPVTSEAEERAKREAEEQTQQDEAMDPQEAPGKLEQSDPKQDKAGEEEPESDASGSPPDANTGEMEQGEQPAETSHKSPPLQNGMFCLCGLYRDCKDSWQDRLKHEMRACTLLPDAV